VQHEIDGSVDVDVVRDVVLDELEVSVMKVRNIGRVPGQEVIDANDSIAAVEQRLGEVRPDETGSAGNDHAWF
jgi:hypothetical protein